MNARLDKRALLIGTGIYQDTSFSALPCTAVDTAQFRQVLEHPAIGAFDEVRVVADPTASAMRQEINDFMERLGPDDLGVLYISGHGDRLSRTTGEFFFIAADTDSHKIELTGVSATFVNEQLEQCAAPQKVAIFDCCQSGGYSLGFRTRDAKSAKSIEAPLRSRGVYVMSSSGADELSYGGLSSIEPTPSVFTGELVDALRTGRGDTGNDGVVSVEELFHYVNDRVRKRELPTPQTPVSSSDKVSGRIDLARCYAGPPLPVVASQAPPTQPQVGRLSPEDKAHQDPWQLLLDYYRSCVDVVSSDMPLLTVDQADERYVCLAGTERLLSGDLDDTGSIPLPDEAVDLVEQGAGEDSELWYGYPAVVLMKSPSGEPYRTPRFAPLFIRRVEVVPGPEGLRLEPYGEPMPHPRLAEEVLGADRAKAMLGTYQSTWIAGMHSQLVQEARHFLREEFELPDVQQLRPTDLEPAIDIRTPVQGARNAAVLFLASQRNQANTGLVRDLSDIMDRKQTIGQTALGALLDGGAAVNGQQLMGTGWHSVVPLQLNEGQEAVLHAAMTRRLTAATGPPGTGKSQLVANLVATAVSNGQSVLVASTNNRAVDEVWERCEALVPGAIVRTGNKSYREEERKTLQQLLITGPSPVNASTADAELRLAGRALDGAMAGMADKAARERKLLDTALELEKVADELGHRPGALRKQFNGTDLENLARRAEQASRLRFFGRRRRASFLRRISWEGQPSADTCLAIGAWARIEQSWRGQVASLNGLPDDSTQKRALDEQHENVRARSRRLLESCVAAEASSGRQAVRSLLEASAGGRTDWSEVRSVLRYVRGWAVTCLSVRRFPTTPGLFDLVIVDEASQCSIPQVLPVLFRAKRALIIGDVMQLAPVITLKPAQEAEIRRAVGIGASWLEERKSTYHRHSAFHAFETAADGSLLLDEHFRCHPAIAAVVNDQFYGRQLTVLTDVTKQRRLPREAIMWADLSGTAERGRGASWINREEADRVERSVRYLLQQLPEGSDVGVVTPFAAQAALLSRRLRDDERVQVGTVHTFQGGERDAMVFSLVASENMPWKTRQWLTSQLNLWNVAITRARSHLVVVGDRELWRKGASVGAILVAAADTTSSNVSNETRELDPLLLRLHERLSTQVPGSCSLNEVIAGYRVDAVMRDDAGRTTAVILDRGCTDAAPARHLRLYYERQRLVSDPDQGRRAIRVPAWRLFSDDLNVLETSK